MSSPEKELTAVLYSETEPTAQQRARFEKFLAGKYGREVPLIWMREEALRGGFRLEVGTDIYDWSLEGACASSASACSSSIPAASRLSR